MKIKSLLSVILLINATLFVEASPQKPPKIPDRKSDEADLSAPLVVSSEVVTGVEAAAAAVEDTGATASQATDAASLSSSMFQMAGYLWVNGKDTDSQYAKDALSLFNQFCAQSLVDAERLAKSANSNEPRTISCEGRFESRNQCKGTFTGDLYACVIADVTFKPAADNYVTNSYKYGVNSNSFVQEMDRRFNPDNPNDNYVYLFRTINNDGPVAPPTPPTPSPVHHHNPTSSFTINGRLKQDYNLGQFNQKCSQALINGYNNQDAAAAAAAQLDQNLIYCTGKISNKWNCEGIQIDFDYNCIVATVSFQPAPSDSQFTKFKNVVSSNEFNIQLFILKVPSKFQLSSSDSNPTPAPTHSPTLLPTRHPHHPPTPSPITTPPSSCNSWEHDCLKKKNKNDCARYLNSNCLVCKKNKNLKGKKLKNCYKKLGQIYSKAGGTCTV